VAIHWISGCVLTLAVLAHIVRTSFWKGLRAMWVGLDDIRDAIAIAKYSLRISNQPAPRPGKYSFAQKLIHHVFTLVLLTAIVTGGLMMVRIDTPWWDRNPFWLGAATWGIVYVLHGLAALCLLTMVMCHVYFALRPEKWFFTRAMVFGWITRDEYRSHHDKERWQVKE